MRKLLFAATALAALSGLAFAQSVGWPPPAGMLAALGVYNSSPITLTTTQISPLQLDASGNLKTVASGTPSGTQNVNLIQVGSAAIALGQAAMTASVPVVIASNQSPIPTTQSPNAGAVTTTAVTVTNSSSAFLAASTATKFLLCKNESATATIALNFANGTAALNTAGNVTLTPGAVITFDGTQVPTGAITGISSVASSPATCISS